MKNGKPIDTYYSWDGLHLTPEGTKVVQRFFMGHMVSTLKKLKSSTPLGKLLSYLPAFRDLNSK